MNGKIPHLMSYQMVKTVPMLVQREVTGWPHGETKKIANVSTMINMTTHAIVIQERMALPLIKFNLREMRQTTFIKQLALGKSIKLAMETVTNWLKLSQAIDLQVGHVHIIVPN
jgi:hypothetical protein